MMKVHEHEHPLKLFDLQQEIEEKEEEKEEQEQEDDDEDQITEEGFRSRTCGRCNQEISMYHRYYYKCIIGSCDYPLHKFCGDLDLSKRLVHPSHPHPLIVHTDASKMERWSCSVCRGSHWHFEMRYKCPSCDFDFLLDISCAVEARKKVIHHPCHPHLLMPAISRYILCFCNACGKRHDGIFYQCTVCDFFTVHKDCLFLPKKLLIQKATYDAYYHTHSLTISYSFPIKEQRAKHHPRCRLCGGDFFDSGDLWIYKCDKCLYYAHMACATSQIYHTGPPMTIKNYKNFEHPRLLHLPFPDETYSLPKHVLFEESTSSTLAVKEVYLNHNSHQHTLILVEQASSKKINYWCHDPMKKVQLLCNGCVRPITSTMPFFKCNNEEYEHCNFALHEWCTQLPEEIENHPGHSKHPLVLMSNSPEMFFRVFDCAICCLPCNGFSYCCIECKYYIDVTCGLMPAEITHAAHPNHLLSVAHTPELAATRCLLCNLYVYNPVSDPLRRDQLAFSCRECNTYIHPDCAFSLPETIRHKYDNHPMHLSYHPIENHKSEYFCEICEDDLNPHKPFYHCQDCVQSIHIKCAPSILQSEAETYSLYKEDGVHYFMNVKFRGIHSTDGHPHPLSFSQGTMLDGQCSMCELGLQYKMIFKCLKCEFAIDYHCYNRWKKI